MFGSRLSTCPPMACKRPAGLHRHLGKQENIRWDFWSEGGPMGKVDCPADPEGCRDQSRGSTGSSERTAS